MLTIPGASVLDKDRLIGGCSRLAIRVDAGRLDAEVRGLPESLWHARTARGGWHSPTQSIFLRGYPPADGERPIEDRETLAQVPYMREIVYRLIPAQPQRCLLARLPAGAVIGPHVDQADYFRQTVRLHLPVVTNSQVRMYCDGLVYPMMPGEVWALNNCTTHAVWNADPVEPRTHLICDFLPAAGLLGLLAGADRGLGQAQRETEAFLARWQESNRSGRAM